MAKHVIRVPILVLTLMLSGCAQLGLSHWFENNSNAHRAQMERLVADDFASLLIQLNDADSRQLLMTKPTTPFATALQQALQSAGYAVLESAEDDATHVVRFNIESLENQFGTSVGYSVSANTVTLARDYKMKPSGVFPISFMRVMGVGSDGAHVDDSRFRAQDPAETLISGITPDPDLATEVESALAHGNQLIPLITGSDDLSVLDKNKVVRSNMYETLESNFAGFLDGYELVSKTILVFPNDSLRVLPATRAALHQLHGNFEPATDVFSVIGCSHGKTAISNGNELLAQGRSKRILEELIDLGVADSQVLDEGCWANVHFDEMMPRRGVVIELKRRKPS